MTVTYSFNEPAQDARHYQSQILMYEEHQRLAVAEGEDTTDIEAKLAELRTAFLAAGGSFD